MLVLGLTGSIGMGKSTAAAMLRRMGLPVHDSDATVHRLMGRHGKALPAIEAAFPGVVGPGGADRGILGQRVFGDRQALARLEAILHPLVRADSQRFLDCMRRRRRTVAVLDIPLLFEAGRRGGVDHVLVVSAPALIQRQRVLARPGMTEARLDAVLARQMPDREKRRRADIVIPSGLGRAVTFRALKAAVRRLKRRSGPPSPPSRQEPADA
ncbi:MAG: dephospho-CoA kinase [Rhodospirillaceae bacterium]|nr:dephospho-CoA kinase [Rhodospirillaceae bacterium]